MVSFPYYSHTIPISLGILMGIVWERGPMSLGVPENSIDLGVDRVFSERSIYSFWWGAKIRRHDSPRWMYQWLKRCRAQSKFCLFGGDSAR